MKDSVNMFALNLNDFASSRFYTDWYIVHILPSCHVHVWYVLIKASEGNELCNEYLMRSPSE